MPSPGVLVPVLPPPLPSNIKSIRFYETGASTANFDDNKFSFVRINPKDPAEPEQAWCTGLCIRAITANVEFSFDGVNVHGFVLAGTQNTYWDRHEGGVYIRGVGATFHVEAW